MFQSISAITKEFNVVRFNFDHKPEISILVEVDDTEKRYANFHIDWTQLGYDSVPQLHIFDDGWYVLFHYCQDLLVRLADLNDKNATPVQIKQILLELGYRDTTHD